MSFLVLYIFSFRVYIELVHCGELIVQPLSFLLPKSILLWQTLQISFKIWYLIDSFHQLLYISLQSLAIILIQRKLFIDSFQLFLFIFFIILKWFLEHLILLIECFIFFEKFMVKIFNLSYLLIRGSDFLPISFATRLQITAENTMRLLMVRLNFSI